jgi:hypothetical protein
MRISLVNTRLPEIREYLKDNGYSQQDIMNLMDCRTSLFVDSVTVKVRSTERTFELPFTFLFIDKTVRKEGSDKE